MHFFIPAMSPITEEIIDASSISKIKDSDFHFCSFGQWINGKANSKRSLLRM
jgi:hypothetical protein